jgi:hypothetical protein
LVRSQAVQLPLVAEQELQLELHCSQSSVGDGLNWPALHSLTQMPEVRVESAGQEVHASLEAQVAHVESQVSQVLLALAYFPLEHSLKHWPPSRYGVPLSGQVRHAVLPALEQEAHVEWQLVHDAVSATSSVKVLVGHSATHVEPSRNGAESSVQLRQESLPAPEQVPHGESQATQTLPLAHLPAGVHAARQLPGGSEKG